MLTENQAVANLAHRTEAGMQVHVAKADLTLMPVDAIVNPANSLGIMGGGASGAIKRRGGDKIQQGPWPARPSQWARRS
jgi:O-acetyl-ADP-ribose deacetylase